MVNDTLIKIKNDGVEKRYKIKASETPTFEAVVNKIVEFFKDMDVLRYLERRCAESVALYCMHNNATKSYYSTILFDTNHVITVSVRRTQ